MYKSYQTPLKVESFYIVSLPSSMTIWESQTCSRHTLVTEPRWGQGTLGQVDVKLKGTLYPLSFVKSSYSFRTPQDFHIITCHYSHAVWSTWYFYFLINIQIIPRDNFQFLLKCNLGHVNLTVNDRVVGARFQQMR